MIFLKKKRMTFKDFPLLGNDWPFYPLGGLVIAVELRPTHGKVSSVATGDGSELHLNN